jgi:hypothetical protein
MHFKAIVEALSYASGHERQVRITTSDDHEVVGVPTSVDPEFDALEVYLHPVDDPDVEIAVSLTQIRTVEIA